MKYSVPYETAYNLCISVVQFYFLFIRTASSSSEISNRDLVIVAGSSGP